MNSDKTPPPSGFTAEEFEEIVELFKTLIRWRDGEVQKNQEADKARMPPTKE